MNHAVGAAGEHDVGLAAADDLGRLADGLAAGGARGEAVGVGALGVEHAGQVARRACWALAPARPRGRAPSRPVSTNFLSENSPPARGGGHHPREAVEILLPFAGAQVDAEPRRVDACPSTPESRIACLAAPAANCVCRLRWPTRPGLRLRRRSTSRGPRPKSSWESCWRRTAWSCRRRSCRPAGYPTAARAWSPAA